MYNSSNESVERTVNTQAYQKYIQKMVDNSNIRIDFVTLITHLWLSL